MIVHSRAQKAVTAPVLATLALVACAQPAPEPVAPLVTVGITGETQCLDVQSYAAGIRRVIGPVGSRAKIELKCGDQPIVGAGCVATAATGEPWSDGTFFSDGTEWTVGVAGDACSVPVVTVPGSDQPFRCEVAPVDPPPYPTSILVSGCVSVL